MTISFKIMCVFIMKLEKLKENLYAMLIYCEKRNIKLRKYFVDKLSLTLVTNLLGVF